MTGRQLLETTNPYTKQEAMCCGKRRYTTIKDADDMGTGVFDKSLSWFGCGLGW
ncbi:unnamed protein product [Brassica napus]|uniref:(rape) hypothetical protein n=1 Tax=Brassica napus TaxID=3708 RepID=A0A816JXL4_BRANA|nr:unnamed protein product [Brassica napus]